jgi:hypothetical protein
VTTVLVEDVRRITAIPDPVVRNLQITQAYHDLSLGMAALTGAGANWCTFATWASKQAGQSIRREDLLRAFERLLHEEPEVQDDATALLEAGAGLGGHRPRSLSGAVALLWDAVNPAAAFERTSDAVARGNRKVFEEIGAEFANFLALFSGGRPDAAEIATFMAGLREGAPPAGQGLLREAFSHYLQALDVVAPRQKAQLLLLANLKIGFHEQTRLQPEIVEAMNAPVVDPHTLRGRLVAELFPDPGSRVRYWLARLARRAAPLLSARDRLAAETQRIGRRVITASMMTLDLPGGRLVRLGEDLGGHFPDVLASVEQPELATFLRLVDPTPDRSQGASVEDWGDLDQRMRFIANLFRTYHLTAALLEAPFDASQVLDLRAGRLPQGRL